MAVPTRGRREHPRAHGEARLAEESGRTGAGDSSRVWLIDPLCGTANYAQRMAFVAVNAALRESGRVIVAAVGDPFAGEVFWTDGVCAFMRKERHDRPSVPSPASRLVDLNFDPPFPNAETFRAVTLAADEEFTAGFKVRVVSSSLALAWVATGQRAAYITDGDVRDSVHFAAGVALCQVARPCVTDNRSEERGTGPWERRSCAA